MKWSRWQPGRQTAMSVVKGFQTCSAGLPDGRYIPARPIAFQYGGLGGLWNRARLAWSVFCGECDALDWEDRP